MKHPACSPSSTRPRARRYVTALPPESRPSIGKGRILLLRRAPGRALRGLWEIPYGQVEDGEPPELVAKRALLEKTSLANVDLARYPGYFDYPTVADREPHVRSLTSKGPTGAKVPVGYWKRLARTLRETFA
ncbi:NUDIX hydrolase [Microtetraspora glauca]|uniref:NUDIX domain-containing protein n=1 Tax=Microtetraspora glauca TaxID=1996 RepID=A0ABV3GP32_MICGL